MSESMKKRIILGSASPRRRELLEQIGIEFEIVVSDAQEHYESTRPEEIVRELALMKAEHVAEEVERREKERAEQASISRRETGEVHLRNVVILGADTIVVRDGQILGKPSDEEAAFSMLKSLQGRMHQVYTGVAVLDFDGNGKRPENPWIKQALTESRGGSRHTSTGSKATIIMWWDCRSHTCTMR